MSETLSIDQKRAVLKKMMAEKNAEVKEVNVDEMSEEELDKMLEGVG